MGWIKDLFIKKEVEQSNPAPANVITVPECDCRERQQEYVNDVDRLGKEIKTLRTQKGKAEEDASTARVKAKEELAEVKFEHKKTVENIKHMQAMLDEKSDLDKERAVFNAEQKADKEIVKIKATYAEKLETDLKKKDSELSDFMKQVMAALPNVNVQLGKKDVAEE